MCTITLLAPGSGTVSTRRPLARRYSVTPSIETTFFGASAAKPTTEKSINSKPSRRDFMCSEHPVKKVQGGEPGDDRTEGDAVAPSHRDGDHAGQQALVAEREA